MAVVGDTLGRYTLLRRLAGGGMGEVYLAAARGAAGFGAPVALKVLRQEFASDQNFIDMLIDEAKISQFLNHQNIVSVLDFAEDQGDYYLAMEFVQGVTVEYLVEQLKQRGKRLDLAVGLFIGSELCRALKYAHSCTNHLGEPLNVVHRDVTPANVLLSVQGEVKLTDFGIARAKGRMHQTQAGVVKGKFGYLAPEMTRYETIDARADLFSAGVLLYQMLSGTHPVQGASIMEAIFRYEEKHIKKPSQFNPEINAALDDAIMRALEPAPSNRWSSAQELGTTLQQIGMANPSWRRGVQQGSQALAALIKEIAPEVLGDPLSLLDEQDKGVKSNAWTNVPRPPKKKDDPLIPSEMPDSQDLPPNYANLNTRDFALGSEDATVGMAAVKSGQVPSIPRDPSLLEPLPSGMQSTDIDELLDSRNPVTDPGDDFSGDATVAGSAESAFGDKTIAGAPIGFGDKTIAGAPAGFGDQTSADFPALPDPEAIAMPQVTDTSVESFEDSTRMEPTGFGDTTAQNEKLEDPRPNDSGDLLPATAPEPFARSAQSVSAKSGPAKAAAAKPAIAPGDGIEDTVESSFGASTEFDVFGQKGPPPPSSNFGEQTVADPSFRALPMPARPASDPYTPISVESVPSPVVPTDPDSEYGHEPTRLRPPDSPDLPVRPAAPAAKPAAPQKPNVIVPEIRVPPPEPRPRAPSALPKPTAPKSGAGSKSAVVPQPVLAKLPQPAPSQPPRSPAANANSGAPGASGSFGGNTDKWVAGEIDGKSLSWNDEDAGRRAIATRHMAPGTEAPAPRAGNAIVQPATPSSPIAPQAIARITPAAPNAPREWSSGAQPMIAQDVAPDTARGHVNDIPLAHPGSKSKIFVLSLGIAALAIFVLAGVLIYPRILKPSLQINTMPAGASVKVDGVEIAEPTPTTLEVEPGKRLRVEIVLEGYDDAIREVAELDRGQTLSIAVNLIRYAPEIHVTPVGAKVILNGQTMGEGQTVKLPVLDPAEPVDLIVEARGYETQQIHFARGTKVPRSIDIVLRAK